MKIQGFIRWYDETSDDGILQDFEGNQYYFNSWSFPKTVYRVTGKCKKTGRKKTIRTRYFPGLWLNYKVLKDNACYEIQYKYNIPVEFEQFAGSERLWAINVKLRWDLQEDVFSYRLESSFNSVYYGDVSPIWEKYAVRQLDHLIEEVLSFERK